MLCIANKIVIAVPVLFSLLERYAVKVRESNTLDIEKSKEIINILCMFDSRDHDTAALLARPASLECIGRALHLGGSDTRIHAVVLVAELVQHRKLRDTMGSKALVGGLVEVLSNDLSIRATKASLNALLALCTSKLARVTAVEAGAIPALVELLLQEEKTVCQKALASLELLLLCPEGRSATGAHSQLIPRIVEKILTIWKEAIEYAIAALWSLCNYCPFLSGYYDTLREGAVEKAKLLLVKGDYYPQTTYQTRQLLNSLHSASGLLEREFSEAIQTSKKPSSDVKSKRQHQTMSKLEVTSY